MTTQVIRLGCPVSGPGWPAEITNTVIRAANHIRALDTGSPVRAVLVLEQRGHDTPAYIRLSAQSALQSLIHASTLERPAVSLCLVFTDSPENADLERTLEYTTGPAGAFTQGATIDLGIAP